MNYFYFLSKKINVKNELEIYENGKRILGEFRLSKIIGEGTFGKVMMAIHEKTGEKELYITESVDGPQWPTEGIQRNTYDLWTQLIEEEQESTTWLPLRDEYSKKFDTEKAWEFFNKVNGTPYGYPTLLFGWIDTLHRNFPPLLDFNFVYTMFILLEKRGYKVISEIMAEALNIRLGTKDLSYPELAVEAYKQNTTIFDLLAVPEEQGIKYSIGESYVCSALATALYKASGVFDDLKILPQEFTPRDMYQLSIYKDGSDRPDECKINDPSIPYCQLRGDIKMEFDGFNAIKPYSNMNERCSSLPPLYERELGC